MYLIINKWVIAVKVSNFSGQYLRNHRTLDIGVLGYIGIVWPKEHFPEVRSFPPGTPCIKKRSIWLRCIRCFYHTPATLLYVRIVENNGDVLSKNSDPTWRIFTKFRIWVPPSPKKSVTREFKFYFNPSPIADTVREDLCAFMTASHFFLQWEMCLIKSIEKIPNTFCIQ